MKSVVASLNIVYLREPVKELLKCVIWFLIKIAAVAHFHIIRVLIEKDLSSQI